MRVKRKCVDVNIHANFEGQVNSPLGNYYGSVGVARVDGKPFMLLGDYGDTQGVEISEVFYAEFVKEFKDTPD